MPFVGRQADEPSEAVVRGALGEVPEAGELCEGGVGVLEPEREHLNQKLAAPMYKAPREMI